MRISARELFTTIRTEGGLLPVDLLQRIAIGDSGLEGLTPETYHLSRNERLNEAISRTWSRLLVVWKAFRSSLAALPEHDRGTTVTRERWLLILFQELGYGRLLAAKATEIDGKSYPISHFWQNCPIHLVGARIDLDRRTPGVTGAAHKSPHSLAQEFLNRNDDHLWGFVSNGLCLRILRDNISLTRQAYIEFDLESMLEGEVYADFVILWLLCHQSRVEAEKPEECWLERWLKTVHQQGIRALDSLRSGVEEAIKALGKGFIDHPANTELRHKLYSGVLSDQDYFRQLLRLVYRLLFLFVSEDRNLILNPQGNEVAQKRYNRWYSTGRLRRLAERQRGTKHVDLYRGLRVVMEHLGSDKGCPGLALPALGSFLWGVEAIPDLVNCDIANHYFLDAIRSLAFTTDGKIRHAVDYKNLGAEELGSIYESLLELYPRINLEASTFELETASGHERKTTGSYYTPTSLIKCLLDSALEPVLDKAARKQNPEQAVLSLKVCDPACGSGHFLIAAAHRIAKRLAAIRTGDDEPAPAALHTALREVISHCIYGVDINPMAVELCKVNLWLESLEPGKPLSFLDHRIRCGNSLLGTTPALLKKGIPDDAFKPITGDDKTICSADKKQNRDERKGQSSMFLQDDMPWSRLGNLSTAMVSLDGIADDTIEGVHEKEKLYAKLVSSSGYLYGHLLADAWCAAFVWPKKRGAFLPITEEIFRKIEKTPYSISPSMQDEIIRIAKQYQFFHWHLEFPDVFRVPVKYEQSDNEQNGWCGGFDLVLGNPPWERIKLQEKEWFAKTRPDIAKASNAAARRRMIAALETEDPALYAAFMVDKRKAEGESHLVRDSGYYPLCGRGDVNTYALFAELKRNLINPAGRVGCIVPSGIATDDTTKFFFQSLMDLRSLVSLYDFENREGLFPGVHRSYKFCLLTITGQAQPAKAGAEFAFFLHRTEQLREEERRFTLTAEDIALLNPNTRTCSIFRSKRDAELTKNIYRRVPVLIKELPAEENPWKLSFIAMLHQSGDSHLFEDEMKLVEKGYLLRDVEFVKGTNQFVRIYFGRMFHHFDHRWATLEGVKMRDCTSEEKTNPNFFAFSRDWVSSADVHSCLHGKWSKNWLLGWRDITNTTNERTVIASFLPWVGVGHLAPLMAPMLEDITSITMLIANLCSFSLDYCARQKLGGTNLTYGYLKQFPLLPPSLFSKTYTWIGVTSIKHWIIDRVLELTYTAWDLEPFAQDCGYSGPPFIWDDERRFLIRCELDAVFFHLYGIARDDVDYIMETFPIVKRKDEAKYGEYRTKRVILEVYDAMQQAMETGKVYQTIVNPPPADPSVAHPPRQEEARPRLVVDPAFPRTELERLLCAATLELIHKVPNMPNEAYLDALYLATHPNHCEVLLAEEDKTGFSRARYNVPQALFLAEGQRMGWQRIRDYLEAVQAIYITDRHEEQRLTPGARYAEIRNGLPQGAEPIISFALKAAKRLQEAQAEIQPQIWLPGDIISNILYYISLERQAA